MVALDDTFRQNVLKYESGLVSSLSFIAWQGNSKAALAGTLNAAVEPNLA